MTCKLCNGTGIAARKEIKNGTVPYKSYRVLKCPCVAASLLSEKAPAYREVIERELQILITRAMKKGSFDAPTKKQQVKNDVAALIMDLTLQRYAMNHVVWVTDGQLINDIFSNNTEYYYYNSGVSHLIIDIGSGGVYTEEATQGITDIVSSRMASNLGIYLFSINDMETSRGWVGHLLDIPKIINKSFGEKYEW